MINPDPADGPAASAEDYKTLEAAWEAFRAWLHSGPQNLWTQQRAHIATIRSARR